MVPDHLLATAMSITPTWGTTARAVTPPKASQMSAVVRGRAFRAMDAMPLPAMAAAARPKRSRPMPYSPTLAESITKTIE